MRRLILRQQEKLLYLFIVFASILLSIWIDARETVINPDGICYLLAAETVGKSGLLSAMQLCGQATWPFYSLLIYGFSQFSHLSYEVTAYTLNSIFSLGSVLFFVLIVKELGGNKRVLWLAAGVILLSHEFNSVREYIIRDHGFWVFYLTSLWCLIRYFKKPSIIFALGWSLSIITATLFRIEGAIFLIIIPFVSWFYVHRPLSQRVKTFFLLNLPTIIICSVIAMWLFANPQETLNKFGRLAELSQQLQHAFALMVERFAHTKLSLAKHVLTIDSAKEAGWLLFVVMLVWYLISVVSNLSLPYTLLALYAWWQRAVRLSSSIKLVIYGYLIVNVAVTCCFLFERLFLSKRYLIALSLIFMLFVPFALERLIQQCDYLKYRVALVIITCLILAAALGGIFDFGYSKAYIHRAGDWLAQNVPADASLYANDYQLMYYSQHFGNTIFQKLHPYVRHEAISNGQWKQYDYLAFRLDKKKGRKINLILKEIPYTPIKVFKNKRGDRVAVYKIEHQSS